MTITIKGIITDITFQNEDNGYTVLLVQEEGSPHSVTCVGTMPTVAPGETVVLQGDWEIHRRFGRQLTVERYEIVKPTTLRGITMLLGSGLIANIGPLRAQTIVERFGLDTLDVLENEPSRLLEVRGIGPKTFEKITGAWQRQRHIRDLMLYLQEIGVSVNLATRIYKTYGVQAKEKVSSDPYALLDDVWGVGFVKADQIAQKMGFKHDSYKRVRAGIAYLLSDAAGSAGHTCVAAEELVGKAAVLLGVEKEIAVYSLDHAVTAGLLIRENDRVYLPVYYHAERMSAGYLLARIAPPAGAGVGSWTYDDIGAWLDAYERRTQWRSDPIQREAILTALSQPTFLLTGGPGTGKTTILQVIVSFLREHRRLVALTAPTGRAAERMGSVAGIAAQTIHRLLEFKGGEQGFRFFRNEKNPIEADVVIVDECSMVDILLMRNLLAAIKPATSVVFVGDNNQLPSVGAGNVLADLITSHAIPHVHLTTIFRQASASRIVTAAHEIIAGKVPMFTNNETDNCFFITRDDPAECADTIVDLVTRRLPSRYGFDPVADIQVLSPMHKGPAGTQNITVLLQKALARSEKKICRGAVTFFLGDKVLQVRNNYDRGVFNGDIGIVTAVDDEAGLTVDFNGASVGYDPRDLDELIPAYCMSVHKSQGCEFKAVVIPLVTQHYILLQRNLLYTALTRARQLCVLVGSTRALEIAVKNKQAAQRSSSLADRIAGGFGNTVAAPVRE
jgi:exodeoxyribonuclease V alpha subunit